jgi:hypothetical protein
MAYKSSTSVVSSEDDHITKIQLLSVLHCDFSFTPPRKITLKIDLLKDIFYFSRYISFLEYPGEFIYIKIFRSKILAALNYFMKCPIMVDNILKPSVH